MLELLIHTGVLLADARICGIPIFAMPATFGPRAGVAVRLPGAYEVELQLSAAEQDLAKSGASR